MRLQSLFSLLLLLPTLLPAALAGTTPLPQIFPIPPEAVRPNTQRQQQFVAAESHSKQPVLPTTIAEIPAIRVDGDYLKRQKGALGVFLLSQLGYLAASAQNDEDRALISEKLDELISVLLKQDSIPFENAHAISWAGLEHNILHLVPIMQTQGRYDAFAEHYIRLLLPMLDEDKIIINLDVARHRLPLAWVLVAHMRPENLRHQYALKLQRLMNEALASRWPQAYSPHDLLTPDGGVIHHGCFHPAYAAYSLPGLTRLAAQLQHSAYPLNPEAVQRLKTALRVLSFATLEDLSIPGNLNARTDVTALSFRLLPQMLLDIAKLSADDPDMIALYLAKTRGNDSKARDNDSRATVARYRAEGYQPAPLEGHLSLNVAASALHRRNRWLAVMKGARNDRRGAEIYAKPGTGNNYARFAINGHLAIYTAENPANGLIDSPANGFERNGWNWSLFPGTTSLLLAPHRLMSPRPGYVHNARGFSGSLAQGDNGLWAMDFDSAEIAFRKSAFFFDNRITILTTDITAKKDAPAVTTVFQQAITEQSAPPVINGDLAEGEPFATTATGLSPNWMVDSLGRGHYVHPFDGELKFTLCTQQWPYLDAMQSPLPADIKALLAKSRLSEEEAARALQYARPTQALFATAYLDHGLRAENQSAAVSVLIDSNPQQMRQFAEAMQTPLQAPYRILQQDTAAHILRDTASGTTAYAIFAHNASLVVDGLLAGNTRPALLMITPKADGSYAVSAGSPDTSLTTALEFRFHGVWQIQLQAELPHQIRHDKGETIVTFPYRDYMPINFRLYK